jgi:hypothetical protein
MKMVWRCGGDEDGVAVWTAAGKKKMVLRLCLFSVFPFVFCGPVIRPQKGADNLQKQNRAGPKLIHFKKIKRGPVQLGLNRGPNKWAS